MAEGKRVVFTRAGDRRDYSRALLSEAETIELERHRRRLGLSKAKMVQMACRTLNRVLSVAEDHERDIAVEMVS